MSGPFAPVLLRRPSAPPSPAVPSSAGLALRVPDFDAPAVSPDRDVAALAEAAARQAAQEAALDAARAEGYDEGQRRAIAALRAERAELEAATLARIAARLEATHEQAERAVEATAASLASLLLAALDAALPAAAARLAPESAALLAAALRPVLDATHGLTLAVAPGFAEATAARIEDRRVEVVEDPSLAPGDAAARWRDGGAIASLAQRRQAVAAMLATFGLAAEER